MTIDYNYYDIPTIPAISATLTYKDETPISIVGDAGGYGLFLQADEGRDRIYISKNMAKLIVEALPNVIAGVIHREEFLAELRAERYFK